MCGTHRFFGWITEYVSHNLAFNSLDLSIPDHCTFWATGSLFFFHFLCSTEFTVPNLGSFSQDVHLSLADIAVYCYELPTSLRVHLKASKTDPFLKGCFIHIGRGNSPLCAVQSLLVYLNFMGNKAGHLFLFQDGRPLSRAYLTDYIGSCPQRVFRVPSQAIAFALGQ